MVSTVFVFVCVLSLSLFSHTSANLPLGTTQVSTATYNDLVHYAHFASAAYLTTCTYVEGARVLQLFSNNGTDTQGLVAVDTNRKEIIVSFRGSSSESDYFTDASVLRDGYSSPISGKHCLLCMAHSGFFGAWTSVQSYVLSTIQSLHTSYPTYSVVCTGHSLGGAITPFCALAVKGLNLNTGVRVYSYGQPRVGNSYFANFVDAQIGTTNVFRGTHTNDTVPQLIPQSQFYNHHSTEYYQYEDPSSIPFVAQCSGQENVYCNDLNVLLGSVSDLFGSNSPHHTYFGVGMGDTC